MTQAALFIAAPTMVLAATPAPSANLPQQTGSLQIPIEGSNGTNAVATITSFKVVNGVLTAVGTITGDVATFVVANSDALASTHA